MKSTHEEETIRKQQMMLAVLENKKGITAFIVFQMHVYCYVFSTWLTG